MVSPIIRIDRSTDLEYPEWVHHLLNPGIENLGPVEFDVRQLIQEYPHGMGVESLVLVEDIFGMIEKNGLRERCLGLREALATQALGVDFYRQYFGGEATICWKTVVVRSDGFRYAPFLMDYRGSVGIDWFLIDCRRTVIDKLVRFPS